MITLRNISEFEFRLTAPVGAITTGTNKSNVAAPFTCALSAILARVSAAGTKPGDASTNVVITINKNGTPIGTITFNGASTTPSAYSFTTVPTFVKGDYISLDVTTGFNGTGPTQPSDLNVWLIVTHRGTGTPSSVQTDSILNID